MKLSGKKKLKSLYFLRFCFLSFLLYVWLMNEAQWAEPDGGIHTIIQSETENDPHDQTDGPTVCLQLGAGPVEHGHQDGGLAHAVVLAAA